MAELAEKEPRQLAAALKGESPATYAVVLSYLSQKKASTILHSLPEETRALIVERLATLGPVPRAVVETLAIWLRKRIGETVPTTFVETGGIRPAVSVLKSLPKDASKALLGFIDQNNPELCQTLRNQLFTFADIAKLSVGDLQKILREVDSRTLATALKGADETTTKKILAGMSKRAAEALQEEMGFLGKVKPKDIEVAQLAIIEIVRRLESDGQIEIPEETTA
jgi:flagellar motor switch protein FliG